MAFKRNNNVIDNPGNSFATLNPLVGTSSGTFEEGNLKIKTTGNGEMYGYSSIAIPHTGMWYIEFACTPTGIVGISKDLFKNTVSGSTSYGLNEEGRIYENGSDSSGLNSERAWSSGDVIGLVIDSSANNLSWYKNGTSSSDLIHQHTYDLTTASFFVITGKYSSDSYINFGQDHTFAGTKTDSAGFSPTDGSPGQFYHPPPEGAKALCTSNLSSFDGNPQEHFRAVTWTGTESSGPDDANSIDVGHQPDFIWIKSRNEAHSPYMFDTVRGLSSGNWIRSDSTGPQIDGEARQFNITSTGIDLLTGYNVSNNSNTTYVGWFWKAGGGGGKYNIDGVPYADFADTGLTAGDITPIGMSVNTKAGFSIVKYTGNSNSSSTVPHGLTKAPEMIMLKNLDSADSWAVYHKDVPPTHYLVLNTDAKIADTHNMWNGTTPTNQVFTIGNGGSISEPNENFVAYCWHSVPGYSKFGYVDSLVDDPFVYLGFKPSWVMFKRTSDTSAWQVFDSSRDPHNVCDKVLRANGDNDETSHPALDMLSNGFKTTSYTGVAGGWIYMAFAEHSFATPEQKPSKASSSGIATSTIVATGGEVVESNGYTYHTFKDTDNTVNFVVTEGSGPIEYLIVGGGGGGGGQFYAGGGGAGELLNGTISVSAGSYPIVVGDGGNFGQIGVDSQDGSPSSAFSRTAAGGGGGGTYQTSAGHAGASGGGGSGGIGNSHLFGGGSATGRGTSGGRGHNNGTSNFQGTGGGGGGGASEAGENSTNGNIGGAGGNGSAAYSAWAAATSTGDLGYYAGGGGGGGYDTSKGSAALGGNGGGGNGSDGTSISATNGVDYSGGGGGGGDAHGSASNDGGKGGKGVVIIRYRT